MDENKRKKILIVEDEVIHLDVIKSKLEMEGYEVYVAEDGQEGERLIYEMKPDLVLLDVLLPKKNGLEILRDLQKEKNAPPVIIISNSGQPVEINEAITLGAKDYLVKAQFSPQDVLDKVREFFPRTEKAEKKTGGLFPQCVSAAGAGRELTNAPTVLIVEDDKFLRELIAQKIFGEGFNICSVIGAEETFGLLEKIIPQLVLLDLILPGLDGFEILSRLKQGEKTKSIPVIVLSNLGQQEDIDKAMGLGAADYMVKANFTPGEIVAKIKNVLQKKYL